MCHGDVRTGDTLRDMGRFPEALQAYRLALPAAVADGDRLQEGEAEEGLGATYAGLGRREAALRHLRRALEVYEAIGEQRDATAVRARLARLVGAGPRHAVSVPTPRAGSGDPL